MTKGLFVTWDAGGNLPPALGIAQRLEREGGTAIVLGDPVQRSAVEAAGVAFSAFGAPAPFTPAARGSVARGLVDLLRTTTGSAIAADLRRVAAAEQPDVIVVDCMLARALAEAVSSGIPTVTLVHAFPSFFSGPYASGPVGRLSALRGLRLSRIWGAAAATIATTLPSLEPGQSGPWAGLELVGPVTPAIVDAPPEQLRPRPRALISLSTIWYPGQERTLQRLLDAVAPLDLDAIVTTGRSIDPAALRVPPNAEVHRYVDHDALLPTVDLVVGHGGHGTAMRALAHGLPLLVVPGFSLTDQPYVGQRVAAAGAGRSVKKSAGVEELRAAIASLAAPGAHRDAARRLGAEFEALDPAGAAVRVLERVATQSSSFSAQ
ncbi:MAG: hypothetical protein J7513_12565 [Solirubrobacteraceae bacterium]|nr:hypothetical protein [Solirubrobacteraceae bacterium]